MYELSGVQGGESDPDLDGDDELDVLELESESELDELEEEEEDISLQLLVDSLLLGLFTFLIVSALQEQHRVGCSVVS